MLRALADGLVTVILAPSCAACHASLEEPTRGPVCARCWSSVVPFVPPLCGRCGDPLPSWRVISLEAASCARCRRKPSALTCCAAIGAYEGALRAILHALKYDGRRSLAAPLGALMRRQSGAVLDTADVLVPVPLHRRRQRSRGFNQAEEIAGAIGLPVRHLLRRRRATRSQTDLPAARRHANVRGAFRLAWRADARDLRIVLVDDVCTTGATLESCARVLREAGAADVRAITAARVVSRPPR